MPFSSRVGNITATVLWAAEPVDSHMRVHTWTGWRVWGGQWETFRCAFRDKLMYAEANNATDSVTLLRVFSVRSAAFLTDS